MKLISLLRETVGHPSSGCIGRRPEVASLRAALSTETEAIVARVVPSIYAGDVVIPMTGWRSVGDGPFGIATTE